ncbi:unnamed protein product [Vitrella brassicaformis CCMP3155]|uniref:4-hydroxy-3-methylbut-2-en-1-yl diphosphate synthase (ferredoxin), chloroplastic n=2 Tax=Vitrella brassicaformis TaxID=1169539 RepID=A0A0G4ECH0_VITBC|nr:unnamed protein product [Vitrella brassicaformis CCMP3155]|mmetsp:Transcript_14679/g.35000  ORF Transcript_14679/g.35000 Transcript_14679/m.35000 type:complete len:777 (+) Transcript_14679:561-2891(+)|eukprot:CEL93656.1 unnamed protein product [Vitrella brassicaformis CCMP3155]
MKCVAGSAMRSAALLLLLAGSHVGRCGEIGGAFVVPGTTPLRSDGPRLQRLRRSQYLMDTEAASPILMPGQTSPADLKKYCESLRTTERFPSQTVWIGKVPIGGQHRIALQTMTTSDTRDVKASVEQVMRIADAGADICRLTVQGLKEAEAAAAIREELFKKGYDIPLVADIHFAPKVAMMVADAFEKVRVNPGNFADGAKKFDQLVFDDYSDFLKGRERIEELFTPLVEKCKSLGRAMRIGTNHGSLSNRILSFFGDTPRGMVESALEFADICRANDYHNFCFSMKASNPLVMAQAYRLLVAEMYARGFAYPIHLGVTEAGEGEDGRIKSAIGIGALLQDGIGDTIRVSLTEDPWYELTPCGKLADIARSKLTPEARQKQLAVPEFEETTRDFQTFSRREVDLPSQEPSDTWDVRGLLNRDGSVLSAVTLDDLQQPDKLYAQLGCKLVVGMPFKDIATSDSIFMRRLPDTDDAGRRLALRRLQEVNVGILAPMAELRAKPLADAVGVITLKEYIRDTGPDGYALPEGVIRLAVEVEGDETDDELQQLSTMKPSPALILLRIKPSLSRLHASRRVFDHIKRAGLRVAVIHHLYFTQEEASDAEDLVISSGVEVGSLLVDALGEGIMVEVEGGLPASAPLSLEDLRLISFSILQGSRMRNIKTEFISCPSCGRTLFDLQEVTEQIRQKTGHLPGVSIAVMGCIVNGPGEMADADFGYVGGAPGKVDLYVGKEVVKRGIPNEEACDRLVDLIKEHGRWVEPPSEEEDQQEETKVAVAA